MWYSTTVVSSMAHTGKTLAQRKEKATRRQREHTRRVDEEKARPEAVDAGVAIARVVMSVIMTRRVVDIPARA